MASRNVDTLRAAHLAFNDRQLEECAASLARNGVYRDMARGVEFTGHDQFMEFLKGWAGAFSDCRVDEPRYIDAGDTVVAEFRARGNNDGALGSFKPTHRRIDVAYCEVARFDAQGKITSIAAYWDLLSMLSQLGHLQPPREAQVAAAH